jgi:hypothetical protein
VRSGQNGGRRTATFATSVGEVVFAVMMSIVVIVAAAVGDVAVAC